MSNPFQGIQSVKASVDANYINPGRYINRLDRIVLKKNASNQDTFIIEQMPLHVLETEEVKARVKKGNVIQEVTLRSNKAGVPASQVISFGGNGAIMALPNIKAFALAVLPGFYGKEITPEEITPEVLQLVTSDAQPLAGLMVEVTARLLPTKAVPPTDFTKITYVRVVTNEDRLKMGLITQAQYDLLKSAA